MAGGSPPSPASLPPGERFSGLIRLMRLFLVAAAALALAGLAFDPAGWALVGLLIVAPLVRVGWLAIRWWSRGDKRFGPIAAGLLTMLVAAAVVAVVLA